MRPLFSIIIPIYNSEKYLSHCISSILEQSFNDFELLLINDGSQDGSGAICSKYGERDSRINVIQKTNGGVSSARNMGINTAKGEWILFVDSDDWIEAGTFEEIALCTQVQTADIIVWGIKLHKNGRIHNISVPASGIFNDKLSIDDFLIQADIQGYFGSPCNKLYSKRIIKENRLYFDPEMALMEDSKFNYAYFKHVSSLVAINKSFYNYRLLHNNLSLSSSVPDNYIDVWHQHSKMRYNFFLTYDGKYKDIFLKHLDKEMELSYVLALLTMYKHRKSGALRREKIKYILNRGKVKALKGSVIYYVLSTRSTYLIDSYFHARFFVINISKLLSKIFLNSNAKTKVISFV